MNKNNKEDKWINTQKYLDRLNQNCKHRTLWACFYYVLAVSVIAAIILSVMKWVIKSAF